MKAIWALGALVLTWGLAVSAQSSSTSASTGGGESKTSVHDLIRNKKFEEDKDITDAKLKVDSGSLSKYSMKFTATYYGPMIGDPLAKDQPNPNNSRTPKETAMKGSFGFRYRMDPKTAISAGAGVSAIYPFHGLQRFDVQSPYISYDMSSRVHDVQLRNSFGTSIVTIPAYTQVGETNSLDYSFSSVYDLGTSRVAVGTDATASYYFYNRGYERTDGKATRIALGLFPMAKYNFSSKLNMNTSLGFAWNNLRSESSQTAMETQKTTWRVGAGYAYTRDVYIAPYINAYTEIMTWETTTVNIATVFSIL